MLDQTDLTTPTGAETPSEPSTSTPSRGLLDGLRERLRKSDRAADVTAEEPTATDDAASTPTTPPVSAAPPTPADDWTPPTSREEELRRVQAEADRREHKRQQDERARQERERQETRATLTQQYREAKASYGADSLEAAQLAAQIDDLDQGLERDQYDAQSYGQMAQQFSAQAAARTHKAAFGPLLEGLPDAEVESLSKWWMDHTQPDATTGLAKVKAEDALTQLAKRITASRDEHIAQQVYDGLLEELDKNPELRAQFKHHILGAAQEDPEHLMGGSGAGLPTDEVLSAMKPQHYAKLKLSPEAERRLLTRPNRRN